MTRGYAAVLPAFLAISLAVADAAGAQAPRQRERPAPRRERAAAGSVDPRAVRAEYAGTLLQARRYREAAAEYRRLLQLEPQNFEWRLNYARALAWGNAHREAEVELRQLSSRAPRNAAVEELLRSVRASIEPASREAARWVAERPNHLPYRLALARAFVREGRPRRSFEHFDVVLARQPSSALLGEAGDARAAAGDRPGAADLYRRAVERAPSDPAMRRAYARALVANRQYAAAIEQYNLLEGAKSDPRVLAERGQVYLQVRDEAAAERDLNASIALRPTAETYTLLGDMYRWRGRFGRARGAYDQALELRPQDRRVKARLAQLTREERPGFGFASLMDEEIGVTLDGGATADNTGFVYAATEGRVGFPFGPGTVLGLGVEPRLVRDGSPGGVVADDLAVTRQVVGTAASIGLAHALRTEDVDARVVGRAGAAAHSAGRPVPVLAGAAVASYRGAWSLSLEATGGPAYDHVMALATTEEPVGPGVALMTARTFGAAVTVPFGIGDLGALYESLWLSDGNVRSVFQASVRVPLLSRLSLLYSGGSMAFAERSTLYWDPPEYLSHAVGVELGVRTDEGLSLTARVLPGVARTVEGFTPGDPSRFGETAPGLARFVGQIQASADVSIRRRHWETGLGVAYGRGRAGGYQQFDGNLRVRYVP